MGVPTSVVGYIPAMPRREGYEVHKKDMWWHWGGGIIIINYVYVLRSLHLLCRYTRLLNPLTPNDLYMSHTAPLTSKRCILYIYPTNVVTEYFKHALYSQFFSLQNAVCFIMLTCLVPVLFTFYIQSILKLKKKVIPAPKS